MKKAFIFLLSLTTIFIGITTCGFSVAARIPPDLFFPIIGDGGGGGEPTQNMSKLGAFEVKEDSNKEIKLLGQSISDSYSVKSTRNEIMGSVYTEYEYYRIGKNKNNTYNILVLYKTTMEPKDNVKYANGMGNWFTETGDASSEYTKLTLELDSIGSALYLGSEPTSTIITYTSTVSVSYTFTTDPSTGLSYVEPTIEVSKSATYPSVVVENNSSRSDNKVDIKHRYTENDSYSMNSNVQFGCFWFTVPTSSSPILLRLTTEGQFSIAEGGRWGSCWGTALGTHNNYITIS